MLARIAGAVIIVLVIFEVFQDLFKPARRGLLSGWIGRAFFTLFRRPRSLLPWAGPSALVTLIGIWVALLVLGFGLIYASAFPQEFVTNTGAMPPASPRFTSAFYFSFETLITLGYGDWMPHSTWLRFLSAAEGLLGFGVLTASVSSIVLLYPALARVRELARVTAQLDAAARQTRIPVDAIDSEALLIGLMRDVIRVRIDFLHFPVIYYFASGDQNASVARWGPTLCGIAQRAAGDSHPAAVRVAALALKAALEDLAELLGDQFLDLRGVTTEEIFQALARDHGVETA
jgi:hypothetical protein